MRKPISILFITAGLAAASQAFAQIQLAEPPGQAAPPPVITLQDALDRARMLDAQFQSAVAGAAVAREDRKQAKSSLLPSVRHSTQYLGTQGNGVTSSGRFISNDGVHLYRSWAVVRQDITPDTLLLTGYKRAQAAEAVANARVEIAQRGLAVTVTKNYYALIAAQRKYSTSQQALQQAQRFLEITQRSEDAGQAAHSDVVKADLQYEQQKQNFQEAALAMEVARLNLAVLLFPTLNENFAAVDDLDSPRTLPPFPDVQVMAERLNPDLRAAEQVLRQAGFDVRGAKNGLLPGLSIEGVYGIEANAFALRSRVAAEPEHGPLPNPGYFITASLSVPIFDWGTLRSRVRQAETREHQARVELSQTQRQLVANLYAFYNEAAVARGAVDSVRRAADLASESLRLVNLRYQAGESTVLEVVDAQNTLTQARNAYDDAQTRYRIALAALQTITGGF